MRFNFFIASTICVLCMRPLTADAAPPSTQPASDQAALEEKFVHTMTNANFTGGFTIEGNPNPPKDEHYGIVSVKKMAGDDWLILARIQFGTKDVTVPLVIPVKWAGDTPVICVTDMGVPGLGKYTARVLIYDDHYAGTWSGGATHRGSLFGKIDHAPTTQPAGN